MSISREEQADVIVDDLDYEDGAFALPLDESAQNEPIMNVADEDEHLRTEVEGEQLEQVEQEPAVDVACVEEEVNDAAGAEEIQISPDGISLDPASTAAALAEARSADSNALAGERQNA